MSSFRKPKASTHKRFLYIDENDVLNSLSTLEGGAIDEILHKGSAESSGGAGVEASIELPGMGKVGGHGGKNKAQRLEEEIRRRRTVYSATIALLNNLHENDAVGVVEGEYTPEIYDELEENMVIELEAEIRIHPLHQLVNVMQGWSQLAQDFGLPKKEVREFMSVAQQIETAFHGKDKAKQTLVMFAEAGGEEYSEYKLVMPVKRNHMLVPVDEFAGKATFIAQIEHILEDREEYLAARVVRNSPVLPAEREMMLEMLPALEALQEEPGFGLGIERSDVVLSKPAIILKPLCVYK